MNFILFFTKNKIISFQIHLKIQKINIWKILEKCEAKNWQNELISFGHHLAIISNSFFNEKTQLFIWNSFQMQKMVTAM